MFLPGCVERIKAYIPHDAGVLALADAAQLERDARQERSSWI
jgi:hypothetical protein